GASYVDVRWSMLEPDEAKVSSPVLRGGGGGNATLLPDHLTAAADSVFRVHRLTGRRGQVSGGVRQQRGMGGASLEREEGNRTCSLTKSPTRGLTFLRKLSHHAARGRGSPSAPWSEPSSR